MKLVHSVEEELIVLIRKNPLQPDETRVVRLKDGSTLLSISENPDFLEAMATINDAGKIFYVGVSKRGTT